MNADIGLIGLAVMGQNLVLNMDEQGFKVVVYNRTFAKTESFVTSQGPQTRIQASQSLEELCNKLKKPRKIMLMIKAGTAVDATIESLRPYLDEGDVIIDGGNSLYTDTQRRCQELEQSGIYYIGMGVSGGEEGARHGPSLMPGGHEAAWPLVKELFQSIAAKVDGQACCEWMGQGGAGHYVKMVHNGIEYGDMQLICESYQLLREGLGLSVEELETTFSQWQQGVLDSYLVEITRDIFRVKDSDGQALIDKILDTAGQKGTGKWTAINALETGIPLTLIGEAVFARYLSALKQQRVTASKCIKGPEATFQGDSEEYVRHIHDALYASKIVSYAQGFMLMAQISKDRQWQLNFGNIASVWRGGCIIRSRFLGNIKQAYDSNPESENLLLDDFFRTAVEQAQTGWRQSIQLAVSLGIPTPALSSALAFFDGFRSERVPANLLQAQRDYFGAHTYERIDRERGEFFHTQWT